MHPKLLTGSLLLFFLAFTAGAFAQSAGPTADDSVLIRRLADTILTDGKAYNNLRVLTKTIGARLSGSAGFYKGEKWGQAALEDAGSDKVWLQECMVPHWVRGGRDSARMHVHVATKGSDAPTKADLDSPMVLRNTVNTTDLTGPLDILALGNSVGTGPGGITAPVILIHDFDELERRKDELKGKIVFYNYKFNPLFIETFRAYGDAVRYRGAGASRAAKYGAVAVLVRSMSSSVDNNPHTGAMNYNDSFPKIPSAAVGLRDADLMATALERPGTTVTVTMRTLAHMLPDTIAHNVIGELKGSEFPDQYITVGGHLDSWDPAEGAQDDGAGMVQSIEVLRALKAIGYHPRHTIRVVLFANEENGGRGGRKYSEAAKAAGEKHLFGLESDAGGFTPRAFTLSMSQDSLAAISSWVKLLQPYGVYMLEQGGGGADVSPMRPQLGAVVGELHPDSQRYFDYHHSRADVLENVNKRELELGTVNMAALIYLADKYGL
jgi:carboxypeptidase Q